MVAVDHEVAGGHGRKFGKERISRFLALGAADKPVAEQVLFGDNGEGRGNETPVERHDDERDFALGGESLCLLPCIGHCRAGQTVIGDEARQTLARAA